MKAKQTTEKKWIRRRHRFWRNVAFFFLYPFVRLKYHAKPTRFSGQGKRPYLILYNHQTPFDQFFVGVSFRGPVYYLATEDIFSNGWVSRLIRRLVAPIPIKKQTVDASAVRTLLRVVREGGTVAIAPEGNRTYSGKLGFINPAIAPLAKKCRLPIALYRIEGGYGVEPRWSDRVRRGKIRAYVSSVIEPEEYDALSDEELYETIVSGLSVDEFGQERRYLSRRRAEYLERCLYVCPFCGLSEFLSAGNTVTCQSCGNRVEYGENLRLTGLDKPIPFARFCDWYDYQNDFIRALDPADHVAEPAFRDRVDLYEVVLFKRKNRLKTGAALSLYGDRVVIDEGSDSETVLPFSALSAAAVLGRNKCNFYYDDKVYQCKGDKRFNALKYVNFFYHFKNRTGETNNGEFLGL